MRKFLTKQISILVIMLMCLSTLGTFSVAAAGVDVLYMPEVALGSLKNPKSDFDARYSAIQSNPSASWAGTSFYGYPYSSYDTCSSAWTVKPESEGSENIVLSASTPSVYRDIGYEDNGINVPLRKYEIKVKFSDVTTGSALVLSNSPRDAFRWASDYCTGVVISAGNVSVYQRGVAQTEVPVALAEALTSNVWYKLEKYLNVTDSGNTQRIRIYKVTNNGEANEELTLIGDTGNEWLTCVAGGANGNHDDYSTLRMIGLAVNSSGSEIQFDEFNAYSVDRLTSALDGHNPGETLTFELSKPIDTSLAADITATLGSYNGQVSYNAEENKLNVVIPEAEYETSYTLTIAGDAINTSTFNVSTGLDPKDPYRPHLDMVSNEVLEDIYHNDSDDMEKLYTNNPGADWDGGNSGYAFGWTKNESGAFSMADDGTGNLVIKAGEDTGHNEATAPVSHQSFSPNADMQKYEMKFKLSSTSDSIKMLWTTVSDMLRAVGEASVTATNNFIRYDSDGKVAFMAGTTRHDITLSESIAANQWYQAVKYMDTVNDKTRAMIYKVNNFGTAAETLTLIGDTGESWISSNTEPTRFGFAVLTSNGGVVTIDDLYVSEVKGATETLSDETSVGIGTVVFGLDAIMDASTFDADDIVLKNEDTNKTVDLISAQYKAGANQIEVTLPVLEYETNYTLTFKKDFIKTTTIAEFGEALTMRNDKVFEFATGPDKVVIVSKRFLNSEGADIGTAQTLNVNDTVKAEVKIANEDVSGGQYLVICALYNKNGKLYDVEVKSGAVTNNAEGETIITEALTVTEAESRADIMVWKSWGDISPRTVKSTLPTNN